MLVLIHPTGIELTESMMAEEEAHKTLHDGYNY